MEFKQILRKLKYCNRFNRSSLSKEIIGYIRHVNKTELLIILENLNDTADMEYKVQLINILTAYLLQNNSNRDVIIKSTFLYEPLRMILARALPLKTAIALNFITTLLYAEDDGGSRSRMLTLHAQNVIRSSGCLTAMTHLFMNNMLHSETLQALCRCLAEVCHGSEKNQNFCSHLVPMCVQRCLQGNLDVLPVLQSLLFNHKRNSNLFMETDGAVIFNRKDYLRSEACLQLLNIVIQNAEVNTICTMSTRVHENLQDLLKTNSANLNIAQWIKIVLYYLDLKLKESDKSYKVTTTKLNQNTSHIMDSNVNDTQILFQNIMTEILSYPSTTRGCIPLNNLNKVSDTLSNLKKYSRIIKDTESYKSNNLESNLAPPTNSNVSKDNRLSFSFLMDDSFNLNLSDYNDKKNNNDRQRNVNRTVLNNKRFNESIQECSKLYDGFEIFNSKWENMTDFKPTFVSTPKRPTKMHNITRNTSTKTSSNELNNKSKMINRTTIKKVPKRSVLQEKQNIKHKSMTSRIFEAINESCTTVIKSVKNVFAGNKSSIVPTNANIKNVKNDDQKSHCSYSFTNYMHRREAGLLESVTHKDVSSEINTFNTLKMCNTCDDTFLLQQKLASDEQLKYTVKKLKLGINLYGCDFKRISKTMWPRETYMTPSVLYNLYRKLLVK